jgi:phage repressor protein C with HTH and peptisase S24 domain
MLRHQDIWVAVDRLAADHGLSPSGLARRAGLDPTTFNRSKRAGVDGKLRWPSTESIAKILAATGTGLGEFVGLIGESGGGAWRNLPVTDLGMADKPGAFDPQGHPAGSAWDEIPFPDLADPRAYAIEISGSELEPVWRDGDLVVVSPHAAVRRGDRVAALIHGNRLVLRRLSRRSARRIELTPVNGRGEDLVLPVADVTWLARIVWASQ